LYCNGVLDILTGSLLEPYRH